jgi:hypothetical protein
VVVVEGVSSFSRTKFYVIQEKRGKCGQFHWIYLNTHFSSESRVVPRQPIEYVMGAAQRAKEIEHVYRADLMPATNYVVIVHSKNGVSLIRRTKKSSI